MDGGAWWAAFHGVTKSFPYHIMKIEGTFQPTHLLFPVPVQVADLIDKFCLCSDRSTDLPFSHLSPSPWAS